MDSDHSAVFAIFGSLVTAVATLAGVIAYLYKKILHLTEAEGRCRAEVLSLTIMVEQLRWSGNVSIDAVITANMSTGAIIEWSPGATILLHWTAREMLGKSISRIMPERYREKHQEVVNKLRSGDTSPTRGPINVYALTKDGIEIPVAIFLSGWRDSGVPFVSAILTRRPDSATTPQR